MRQVERIVAAALAGVVVSSAAAQDAVQWRVEDGGNGHWYQLIENSTPTCWQDARTNAESIGSELASLETLLEFEFAKSLAYSGKGPYGAHVGLIQEEGAEEPAGGWKWLSGVPLQYDEWASTLDNAGGCQDTAAFSDGSGFGKLDDIYPCGGCEFQSVLPYTLVEWSADCNGDGIVDYGQILTGTLEDQDGNGIPDCCQSGSGCPQQWQVEDGGNGHWYQSAINAGPMNWNDAREHAAERGGHLVTVTTPSESAWVINVLGATDEHLGAFQDTSAPEYSEPAGGWRWVTGEEWNYTNWEPGSFDNNNGRDPSEEFSAFCCGGTWNDIYLTDRFAIIEWSADCNGDGIVDYGQILDGTFADEDGNGVPDLCEICIGDLNGDGLVGPPDLGILLSLWDTDGTPNGADINGDGTVNASDLGPLLGGWGVCP